MRVLIGARRAEENADETLDARLDSRFFCELAHDRICRRFDGIDPAGDEAPFAVVDAPREQERSLIVEDRGVDTDVRGE